MQDARALVRGHGELEKKTALFLLAAAVVALVIPIFFICSYEVVVSRAHAFVSIFLSFSSEMRFENHIMQIVVSQRRFRVLSFCKKKIYCNFLLVDVSQN